MSKSILVVDDDKELNLHLVHALIKYGYTVYSRENGEECIEFIKKTKPSLILIDCFMPKMDGLTAIRIMQNNNYKIPVIMMSSDEISSGGILFLRKPFNISNLIEMINKAFRIKIH